MADFSIGKIGNLVGDIQRTYTWQLRLTLPDLAGVVPNADALEIRCRTVAIPGRSLDVITSNFMGMEQFYPGRNHFTNPFNITFEEFADRKIAKALYAWQQTMFDLNTGASVGDKKRLVAKDCYLQLLDYQGLEVLPSDMGKLRINNAWPESVAEVPLSYAESTALQYSLALRYDTWEYL